MTALTPSSPRLAYNAAGDLVGRIERKGIGFDVVLISKGVGTVKRVRYDTRAGAEKALEAKGAVTWE